MEERVGERRSFIIRDAAVRGDVPARCCTNISDALAENDGLLSLALSSKGGEGNGATNNEHQDAHKNDIVKAISGKLSIGAGRPSGSWLMLLLLLAVLVPSVCLLWFMNQAVRNERLAVRQKLADAYRVNLTLVQNQLESYWRQAAGVLDFEADQSSSPGFFVRQVWAGLADAVICFDAAGNVAYPSAVSAPKPEAPESAWLEAQDLEASRPGDAANAFARLAAQATNADVAARAFQAQARCLIKSGQTNEAVAVLTGPLEDERYRHATDLQGRLLVPNAELMALELLKDSAPNQAPCPAASACGSACSITATRPCRLRNGVSSCASCKSCFPTRVWPRCWRRKTWPLVASKPARCVLAIPCCGPAPCRACGNSLPLTGGWWRCTRPRRCSSGCARAFHRSSCRRM